jgi:hypothetical protein
MLFTATYPAATYEFRHQPFVLSLDQPPEHPYTRVSCGNQKQSAV